MHYLRIGWGTYLVYAVSCLTIFFVYVAIPETSGLSLKEMDQVSGVPEAEVEIRQTGEGARLLGSQIEVRRYSATNAV
jgi:hypothetical protein